MSYEQHISHWRNHRKDKAVQQCSGYGGAGISEPSASNIEQASFDAIVAGTKSYPICIAQGSGGVWYTTDLHNSFGTVINSKEELVRFKEEYI